MKSLTASLAALALAFALPARAQAPAPESKISAHDLAAKLDPQRDSGTSYVRFRMQVPTPGGGKPATLQVQSEERHAAGAADMLYQVLWPAERKGEGVLLHREKDGAVSGTTYAPQGKLRTIDSSRLGESLFGSDLSAADLIENFFAWEQQAVTGTEAVGGVSCTILESKPGAGDHSIYSRVRTWVDPRRMVAMRIEKLDANGRVVREIDTTRVTRDSGRNIPADLAIRRPGQASSTVVDGVAIRHDVPLTDNDFTTEAMKDVKPPRSGKQP
jgi:hypothetical protein